MKIKAIIYTSNTGTTAKYARLLGDETGLPVCELHNASAAAGEEVLYMGWLAAGSIKGYKEAARKWKIRCVCAVGMGETGSQTEEVRKKNRIREEVPVFTLQGGFYPEKLKGIYRMMMNAMAKGVGKKLAEKPDRTPEEDKMYEMMTRGGDYVGTDNLKAVLEWISKE